MILCYNASKCNARSEYVIVVSENFWLYLFDFECWACGGVDTPHPILGVVMSKAKLYNPTATPSDSLTKGFLLYLFLLPLFLATVVALFQGNYKAFFFDMIAFILMFGVAQLSKKGFAQEHDYHRAKLTKAPKIPYKQFAAYLLGLATFYTAWLCASKGMVDSVIMGGLAFVGYWLYYGFDPRKDKLEDFGDISAEVVLETLQEAQGKIKLIKEDITKIKDKELITKINDALEKADIILAAITEDPKDIRSARKFLVVYIDSIANVTKSYLGVTEEEITPQTRERLLGLMDDVKVRFDKEYSRLKANNQFDLDVGIELLKEQIKH